MTVTNKQSGTNVHEIAEGIYRINTPAAIPGTAGFSFNQQWDGAAIWGNLCVVGTMNAAGPVAGMLLT